MMTTRLGYTTRDAAIRASREGNVNPDAAELRDGTWAGVLSLTIDNEGRHGCTIALPRGKVVVAPESADLLAPRR